MSRKKITFIFIALLILVPLIIYGYKYIGKILDYSHRYSPPLADIHLMLLMYIKNNDGKFPSSEEDLIKQGYLRKIQKDNKFIYEITAHPNSDKYWHERSYFDEFKISYGIKAEDIKIENDTVIDIKTGKPLNLIETPLIKGYRGLNSGCRIYSVYLAEEMLKIKNKVLTHDIGKE